MTSISTAKIQDSKKEGCESLEYEEDCYYVKTSATPSFDHCCQEGDQDAFSVHEDEAAARLSRAFVDDQLCADDLCQSEAELFGKENVKMRKTLLSSSQEFLKTIIAKGSSRPQNFNNFLHLRKAEEAPIAMSPDSGINELAGLSPEEQEKQRQEWQLELAKVEEEIQTLRHVLASRVKHSQELKRKLGITVWKEIQDDMSQGIRNVKESNVYQKTESVIKTTAEKTTTLLGGLGSSVTTKLGQLKNSESFRSLEEQVGSAYENVKTKVGTSRSNSMQSFDEALREAEGTRKGSVGAVSPAATPTIPEEKPLS
ncbi:tumor protein D52 isoform X3 [Bacillus rossius redtenbacheri]|uniref:tumor protein D52 isoform X3 n=1 Tax=Bacillus rossius redtenbacheri TaxID=93214 RepID=UPI002FDD26EA